MDAAAPALPLDHRDAGAILSIDLPAIQANWRQLQQRAGGAECAGVVKADAYGLGIERVGPALAAAGCRSFFVAQAQEGMRLRALLPLVQIFVLHGGMASEPADLEAHRLVPVLNGLGAVQAWSAYANRVGRRLRAALQVDTGMARMGMSASEFEALAADPTQQLEGVDVALVMSHLACAEEQDNPFNQQQREAFDRMRARWPRARGSLANSSGIFLGCAFHHDLVRPGAALYGVAPIAGQANPMRPVVRLQARVIQVHAIEAGQTVGYGRTWTASRPTRLATISIGYADGLLRSASSSASAWFDGVRLPMVGRVSMDSVTLDVSRLEPGRLHAGSLVDLLDETHGVDALAAEAGTIAYEILTSLGHRYARNYIGA